MFIAPYEMTGALMSSDAGPKPFLNFFASWAASFPLVLIATPLGGWGIYAAKSYRGARRWILILPLGWLAVVLLLMIIVTHE